MSAFQKPINAAELAPGAVTTAAILDGTILNADVDAAAAIAHSKMAALTASKALVSDGSGIVAVSSVTATELGYVSGVTSAIQTQFTGKVATSVTVNGHALSSNVTVTASDLGLGSVENTALSTWAGSSNLVTLGAFTASGGTISAGNILRVGHTASIALSDGESPFIQVYGADSRSGVSIIRESGDANGSGLYIAKSRAASIGGANVIVQNSDELGRITWSADDGTDLNTPAAGIKAFVDGTPGANDMPGRLVFYTTPDGTSSLAEALRLDNAQLATFAAGIKTAAPSGGTAATWKLGSKVTAVVTLVTTDYLQVEVGGVAYKLALVS